jgi:hypothetical protein
VAVCATFVGFVSVPVMLEPLPAAPPVNPPVTVGAPQLYVVPTGTMSPPAPSTGVTVKAVPLQVEVVFAEITGFGLTVIVAVLFVLIALLQPCDFKFVIVIVVAPLLAKTVVAKLPVPALETVIVTVFPVATLAPLKL